MIGEGKLEQMFFHNNTLLIFSTQTNDTIRAICYGMYEYVNSYSHPLAFCKLPTFCVFSNICVVFFFNATEKVLFSQLY
jgi:hypothetical protein